MTTAYKVREIAGGQVATPAEPAKHPMVELAERAEAPEPFRTTARSRALHGRKAA